MQKQSFYTLFVLTLLQLRTVNAHSLVIVEADPEDPRNVTKSPTNGQAAHETTSVPPATENVQATESTFTKHESTFTKHESTFTKHESTKPSEELMSTTKAVKPTKEAPPCWKKSKEMRAFRDMYAQFGIVLADFTLPDCDHEGYYQPQQCYFNGCHCVDRYGKPTTMVPGELLGTCEESENILADELSP